MTFPVSSAASQGARHTPPPPVDDAARAGARQADAAELALDVTQMALDIVGLVDPTPISDGANGLISLARAARSNCTVPLTPSKRPRLTEAPKWSMAKLA